MNDMERYDLHLDGPAFRAQRELLLRIADLARRKHPYEPAPGDEALLEGLLNLTDAIADQAHDQYGIDCLLSDDEGEA
jgi:fructose 1,6-bisphosphatase